MRSTRCAFLLAALQLLSSSAASAQTSSLGLPPQTRLQLGAFAAAGSGANAAFLLGAAAYHDLQNPAIGSLGIQAEAYGGFAAKGRWEGDVALGLRSTIMRVGTGLDLDLRSGDVAPFLAFTHPLIRGGILARGGQLQASWRFGGQRRFRAGIVLPIGQPLAGRDRPQSDRVTVPGRRTEPGPAAYDLREQVRRLNDVVAPWLQDPRAIRQSLGPQQAADIIAGYHAALERELGRNLADTVRAALLEHLLLPYDRLLGQKRDPEAFGALATATVDSVRAFGPPAVAAVSQVATALEDVIRTQRRRLGDERLVWLPLQLGLRPEQYATQSQLDQLLERATKGQFSDSNQVVYVPNAQFQWELYNSIRDARVYHVLWIHEYDGVNGQGTTDAISYRQTAYGYLTALLERVRAYDADRVLPEYHMIVDQYYYEMASSRFWMELLRDPLGRRVRLPGGPRSWQTTIDSLQAELRAAVARSAALQAEARTRGRAWLRDRVSVHVHITQQADPAFFSGGVLPVIGLSDNALHDHRKLVFYDLTETDPYRGALIITGMGVGEGFVGPNWEDRAAILRGTAAHVVKQQAVRLLTTNGLPAGQLPRWLAATRDTVPRASRAVPPQFDPVAITGLQLHNQVGYGEKQVTVAKALLYSLLPAGAVVKVTNALFLNPLWGSLLLGHVLRGGRVLVMTASSQNSPFGRPEMSLVSDLLARLLVARDTLAPAIQAAGGLLRIGLYDIDLNVEDGAARIDSALVRRARTPWLRALEPFSADVLDSLRTVAADLRRLQRADGISSGARERPLLHMKAQFVASAEGWQNLFEQPGWGAALAAYYRGAAKLTRERSQWAEFEKVAPTTVTHTGGSLLLRQEVLAKQRERPVYYLVFGSFNEDYRSALLDGEAALVISQFGAAISIPDFVLLPSLCTWIEHPAELGKYLPARVGRLTRALRILY